MSFAHDQEQSYSPRRFFAQESLVWILTIVLLALLLALSGCSGKKTGGPGEGAEGEGLYGFSDGDIDSELAARYGSGSIPTAEGEGVFRDIYFAFDSAELTGEDREKIKYNAEILRANPDVKVQLEGHCDERGTSEYNLALGQRRAQSVYDVLVSYGIPRSRVETISYGSEVPLDPRRTEEAWAKNRRVHFTPFRDRTASNQGTAEATRPRF